ncbi:hypothetical protein BDZ89DRAFT_1133381 [Hymenopellis radicata]|nr:hypothetical protein BDZ89DRAFT_1133381 [Hymenopellis radicata]
MVDARLAIPKVLDCSRAVSLSLVPRDGLSRKLEKWLEVEHARGRFAATHGPHASGPLVDLDSNNFLSPLLPDRHGGHDARTPPRPPATIARIPTTTRAFHSGLYCARPIPIDIEAAQYALELVPSYAEYGERLTREQRAAPEKNGKRILERISVLKDAIIQRQEDYM